MILVIVGRAWRRTLGLVGEWVSGFDNVRVLDPAGLSEPGWVHDPEAADADRMALGGSILPASDLSGVVTTIDAVTPSDLPHVCREDQAFVASEMTAFLRTWLRSRDCPVLDRPSEDALSGTAGDAAIWSEATAALGIADRRGQVAPRLRLHQVIVIGGHVVGDAPESVASTAVALAETAQVGAACLTISDGPLRPALYAAWPWWATASRSALHVMVTKAVMLTSGATTDPRRHVGVSVQ